MYAVTCGFVKLIEALVIVISFSANHFGSATDYIAILEGVVLLTLALVAFKKQQTPSMQ